jgi:hypothetical protein
MKNYDNIGNRSRELPVCSAVPQPLRRRVAPNVFLSLHEMTEASTFLCRYTSWVMTNVTLSTNQSLEMCLLMVCGFIFKQFRNDEKIDLQRRTWNTLTAERGSVVVRLL